MEIFCFAGEAKPSINREKEGISARHGDNEFSSGIFKIIQYWFHDYKYGLSTLQTRSDTI